MRYDDTGVRPPREMRGATLNTNLDRAKLARVCARLGSPFAAEAASAGHVAARMIAEAGASWGDLLGVEHAAEPQPPAQRKPKRYAAPRPSRRPTPLSAKRAAEVTRLIRRQGPVTTAEAAFLDRIEAAAAGGMAPAVCDAAALNSLLGRAAQAPSTGGGR